MTTRMKINFKMYFLNDTIFLQEKLLERFKMFRIYQELPDTRWYHLEEIPLKWINSSGCKQINLAIVYFFWDHVWWCDCNIDLLFLDTEVMQGVEIFSFWKTNYYLLHNQYHGCWWPGNAWNQTPFQYNHGSGHGQMEVQPSCYLVLLSTDGKNR